jgi:hypothetical protein
MRKTKMVKKLTPREATALRDICKLKRDNIATRDAWIMLGSKVVVLCTQRNGQSPTGSPGTVRISRAQFNKLIDWYNHG